MNDLSHAGILCGVNLYYVKIACLFPVDLVFLYFQYSRVLQIRNHLLGSGGFFLQGSALYLLLQSTQKL